MKVIQRHSLKGLIYQQRLISLSLNTHEGYMQTVITYYVFLSYEIPECFGPFLIKFFPNLVNLYCYHKRIWFAHTANDC